MCIGKGLLAIRNTDSPVYALDSNDHAPLVKPKGLSDDKPYETRDFVRIECLPKVSLPSLKPADWEIRWDEPNGLPGWFEDEQELWRDRSYKTLLEIILPEWIENGIGGDLSLSGTLCKSSGDIKSIGGYFYARDASAKLIAELKDKGIIGK